MEGTGWVMGSINKTEGQKLSIQHQTIFNDCILSHYLTTVSSCFFKFDFQCYNLKMMFHVESCLIELCMPYPLSLSSTMNHGHVQGFQAHRKSYTFHST